MSAVSPQDRLDTARDRAESVRRTVNHGATLLSILADQHERMPRGVADADRATAAVDGLNLAFPELQGLRLDELVDRVRAAYEPGDDFDDSLRSLDDAYQADDAEAFDAALDGVKAGMTAYVDPLPDDVAREWADLRRQFEEAFSARDENAFEHVAEDAWALCEETTDRAFAAHTKRAREVLSGVETPSLSTVLAELETAREGDDRAAYDARLADLGALFDEHNWAVFGVRREAVGRAFADRRPDDLADRLETLRADVAAGRRRLDEVESRLAEAKRAVVSGFPEDATAVHPGLDDPDQPTLLLPVRLETRFGDDALRVRVYPDQVHVDAHERGLTVREAEDGRRFWRDVWWAAHDVPTSALRSTVGSSAHPDAMADADLSGLPEDAGERHRAVQERAWSRLVERYGPERSAYVKRETAPWKAVELLAGPVAPDEVPQLEESVVTESIDLRPESWTRPPTASMLPDRWVAFVEYEAAGSDVVYAPNPVREPLRVGPDPTAESGGAVGAGAPAWMVEFDAALDAGMALEIDYPAGWSADQVTVTDLVVVGVKSTMTAEESGAALADLLDAHHYSDGLAFLPQGTATNNAADAASGYTSSPDPADSLGAEGGRPLVGGDSPDAGLPGEGEPDGAKAARLLGVAPDGRIPRYGPHVFGRVDGADGTEQRDARHANRALWGATWGSYVPHMMGPESWIGQDRTFGKASLLHDLESYREHFVDHVRARGPLPALRVGRQPYGVLPTTSLDPAEWNPHAFHVDPPEGLDDVAPELTDLVRGLRTAWDRSVADVPHVDEADTGVGEELLDLLAMEGTAFGYEALEFVGEQGWLHAFTEEFDIDDVSEEEKDAFVRLLRELHFDPSEAQAMDDLDAALPGGDFPGVPRVARLLFLSDPGRRVKPLADTGVGEFVATLRETPFDLLRDGPPGRSPVGAGVDLPAWYVYSRLGFGPGFDSTEGADSVLEALLYYATLQEYVLGRIRLHNQGYYEGDEHSLAYEPWELFPEREVYREEDPTAPEAVLERIPLRMAGGDPRLRANDSYADVLDRAAEVDVADGGSEIDRWFRTFVGSLSYLEARDPAPEVAGRLLSETLDLATHRLDAWETSLATKRIEDLRAVQARENSQGKSGGVYVGACGWVTDLSKREADATDGYVQAPSLPQSTTAAVLRSGHLSHDGARQDALAVDLSAERVRLATDLIEGVREGQSLGALLGYRFERALHEHDRDLDVYVREFRTLDPVEAGKMDRESTPTQAVAARNVVDGLALYRRTTGKRAAIPWGSSVPGSSAGTSLPTDGTDANGDHDADYLAIREALDALATAVDAVRDLLTAEGVHQLLNGRPMKSGGSLDALSRGEAPPDLDVTRTPRSGIANTHRVLVLFDESTPYASAWPLDPALHLRGVGEPNLHAWAGALLPDPERVACVASYELPEDADVEPPSPDLVRLSDLDLSPLDVLFVPEGDEDAQASELESRVGYHLVRNEGVPADATIELTFAPVADWSHSAADFDGVAGFEGLVSLGECLEVARRVREVVSGGRAASPTDVQPPASATDDGVLGDELLARADPAVAALEALDAGLDETRAVLDPDDDGTSEADRFGAVGDALVALGDEHDARAIAEGFDGIDPEGMAAGLERLRERIRQGLTVIGTGPDGGVPLAPGEVELRGATTASTAEVAVLIRAGGELLDPAEATVDDEGRFSTTYELAALPPGTPLEIAVHGDSGLLAEYEGVVVEEAVPRHVRVVREGPVDAFLDLFLRHHRLRSDAGSVRRALADLDAAAVRATTARAEAGGFWTDPASDPASLVDDVLELADGGVPGFGGTMPRAWNDLMGAVLPLLIARFSDDVPMLGAVTDGLDRYLNDLAGRVEPVAVALDAGAGSTGEIHEAIAAAADAPAAFRAGAAEALRDLLVRSSHLGVYGSIPQSATGATADDVATLLGQARGVHEEIGERIDAAPATADPTAPDPAVQRERLEAAFGESFLVLPPFAPRNAAELAAALRPSHSEDLQNGDPMAVETWFHRAARMRDQPDALQTAFTYANAVDAAGAGGRPTPTADERLRVAQLPYRPEGDEWVGLPDAWDDDREGGRLSLVVHDGNVVLDGDGSTPSSPAVGGHPWIDDAADLADVEEVFGSGGLDAGRHWAGLFVDEWVETVPATEETTGVALHYDRPNARPPQSMLLAAPPDDDGWSLSRFEGIVDETRAMARRRTVDTESLDRLGQFLPALVFGQNSDDGPGGPDAPTVEFDALAGEEDE